MAIATRGVLVSGTTSAVQARVRWTKISEEDCKTLESLLTESDPKALPKMVLLAGATRKQRFRSKIQGLSISQASKAREFRAWALAELSVNEAGNIEHLYQVFRGRKDQERSWNSLKLLIFSSSIHSQVVLEELHKHGQDDGAVGGLISLYQDYRARLFSTFRGP
jgi:hypothetical protein